MDSELLSTLISLHWLGSMCL